MVDWAGTALPLYDKTTGNSRKVYLFVATLPFSMYCYAQACGTMKEEDWINAHIAMYEFFGGVTRILTPDNLKVGILSNRKYEDPVVNRSYQELADHYHTALLPARVLAPRDKAAVEGSVGNLTSHIIARLRNRKFSKYYGFIRWDHCIALRGGSQQRIHLLIWVAPTFGMGGSMQRIEWLRSHGILREYMSGSSPDWRHSSRYSVQRSFLLTPLRSNSFWM